MEDVTAVLLFVSFGSFMVIWRLVGSRHETGYESRYDSEIESLREMVRDLEEERRRQHYNPRHGADQNGCGALPLIVLALLLLVGLFNVGII